MRIYFIRKYWIQFPYYFIINILEVTPIRSGLRKRKREEAPKNTAPQVSEVWVDESKLELVEIKQFHERYILCSYLFYRILYFIN